MRSSEPMATRLGRVCQALLLTGLVALAGWTDASAQDARGSIAGRVTDTLRRRAARRRRDDRQHRDQHRPTTITTDSQGRYTALYLLPGVYKVSATLDGFRTGVNENVQVRVGDKVQYDVALEPGGVTEEVSVVAERPILETRLGDDGPGDRQQADLRDPARRRHRLRPHPPRRGRVVRALLRAAAADGQRQPARRRRQRAR